MLEGVTLDSVILLGGTDNLDSATSTVNTDSTIQFATLQDGTLTVASGQTLTLDERDARQRRPVGRHLQPRRSHLVVSTDSTIEYATLQDGTLAVASGQTLTLDGVTLDSVTLLGGTDDLDSATSSVNTDSTISSPRSRTARWRWRPGRR